MMTEDIWTMARCVNEARSAGGGSVTASVVTGDGLTGRADERSVLRETNLVPDEIVAKSMGPLNQGIVAAFSIRTSDRNRRLAP